MKWANKMPSDGRDVKRIKRLFIESREVNPFFLAFDFFCHGNIFDRWLAQWSSRWLFIYFRVLTHVGRQGHGGLRPIVLNPMKWVISCGPMDLELARKRIKINQNNTNINAKCNELIFQISYLLFATKNCSNHGSIESIQGNTTISNLLPLKNAMRIICICIFMNVQMKCNFCN